MLQATLPKVPGEVGTQIRQLMTPAALHVIEAVVVLWGLSHFFGFGEVFDALVLATGIVALGADAVHAAQLAMEAFMSASGWSGSSAALRAKPRLTQAMASRREAALVKQRLSVYLDPVVMAQLAAYAARRNKSLSLVAEAAVASFLSPDGPDKLEAALSRRLDRLSRQNDRLERDLGISVEMLALFVRFWLTSTPAMPDTAQAAAQAKGRERFEGFVEALGRRIASGHKTAREISEEMNTGA